MTDQEKIIAIAKACGWEEITSSTMAEEHGIMPIGFHVDEIGNRALSAVPNFLADLNACARMEETLTDAEFMKYTMAARDIVARAKNFVPPYRHLSTTARQRCEAFIAVRGLDPEGGK